MKRKSIKNSTRRQTSSPVRDGFIWHRRTNPSPSCFPPAASLGDGFITATQQVSSSCQMVSGRVERKSSHWSRHSVKADVSVRRTNDTDGEDFSKPLHLIMGEDRVTFGERRNGDVLPSRHRHSSVISSCSEESENTSTGYPPTPDEDKEEELEYGPGIVNKLRTKFLSISLKQNRGTIRRSCSMENLLDQDRPSRSNIFSQSEFNANHKESEEHSSNIWGNLKRAKSMDTLLMDLKQESSSLVPMQTLSEVSGDIKKELKIIRRRDGGLNRTGPTICDEELPKPDTVKTYKRMFEPAESRRGSYSRKPPVLRASAKSGSLSVSKINGVSQSAKVNGIVSKNKLCAKPASPVTAQPETEKVSNSVSNQPLVNGDESKPQCNGNYVKIKALPVKIADKTLCNGNVDKSPEKEINGFNMNKKNLQNNQKNNVVSNGTVSLKELIKNETSENYVNPDIKKLVNQTFTAVNGNDKPVIKPVLNGLNQKPKVPPNRPTFVKHAKFGLKVADVNGIDKKSPLIPKLKPIPTPIQKNIPDVVKPEINNKIEEAVISESKSSEEVVKEVKETEVKSPKISDENKVVEESNIKISEKIETKVEKEINVEKRDSPPKTEVVEKETVNHINGDAVDSEKLISNQKTEVTEIKPEPKPIIKKQQSSEPITTSMVFDFRGKDVVPHVAVLPVPFGCKALHPKKKKSLLIDGKEVVNGNGVASDDEDEYHVDYSVPAPCGVVFEGENVKIGRGSILSVRNKDVSTDIF